MSYEKMGGPAFPEIGQEETLTDANGAITGYRQHHPQSGMTLWDYYAAAALTGLLSARPSSDDHMMREATMAADLMISIRNKRQENN